MERKITLAGGTPRRFKIQNRRSTYFIGAYNKNGKLVSIKIGLATRGKESTRLKCLQTGCPTFKLKFLLIYEGNVERKLQREFGGYRSQGEWFKPAPAILRLVEHLKEAQQLLDKIERKYARDVVVEEPLKFDITYDIIGGVYERANS